MPADTCAHMQDHYEHMDVLSSLVGMSPSSLQYGLGLPDGTVQKSAATMEPIFAYNLECLERCGLPLPTGAAAGPTPSVPAG